MKKVKKMKFKKMKFIKLMIMVLLAILLSMESYTFAKYVINQVSNYFISTKNFYFNSNILKANNPRYEVNNWSGIGEFQITFDLTSKKNKYIHSDYDIPYDAFVTCPSDVTCSIDKSTGVIRSATNVDSIVVSVAPTKLYKEGEKLTIGLRAKSKEPYIKEISATFEYIVGKLGVTYEVADEANRPYLLLNVTNAIDYCKVIQAFDTYSVGDIIDSFDYLRLSDANKEKCVSQKIEVNFNPNKVLLDTVSDILTKATYSSTEINGTRYINKLEFYIGPLSTVDVKFYKKDASKKYTYQEMASGNILTVDVTSTE